jgi:CHAD domain-containing protein
MAGTAPDALHDLRVSIRRFRAGLRLFKHLLTNRTRLAADARLQTLSRDLSPARDSEVWIMALRRECSRSRKDDADKTREYCGLQDRRHSLTTSRLTPLLTSPRTRMTMAYCRTVIRDRIRRSAPTTGRQSFQRIAGRRLRKGLQRLTARRTFRQTDDPDAIHELRKQIRRVRYWAEFAQPTLGKDVTHFVRLLKSLSTSMGQIHDADVFLARLAKSAPSPASLRRQFTAQRVQSVLAFKHYWKQLHRPSFQRRIVACLDRALET